MKRTLSLAFILGSLLVSHPGFPERVPLLLELVWSDDRPSFVEPRPGERSRFICYCDPIWDCVPGTALEVSINIRDASPAEVHISFSSMVRPAADTAEPLEPSSNPWTEVAVTSQTIVLQPMPSAPGFPPFEARIVPRDPPEWNAVSVLSLVPTVEVLGLVGQNRSSVSVGLLNRNRLPIVAVEFGEQFPDEESLRIGSGYFYTERLRGEIIAGSESTWTQEVPVTRRYVRVGGIVRLDTKVDSKRMLTCAKLSDGSVVGKCYSRE